MTESDDARNALALRLLQLSSCFRDGAVCRSAPCACAETLAGALRAAPIPQCEAEPRRMHDSSIGDSYWQDAKGEQWEGSPRCDAGTADALLATVDAIISDNVYVDNDGVAGISSAAEAILAALVPPSEAGREVTDEMVEAGARALWQSSIYHGYNDETLEREWLRMCGIWRNQARQVLAAALSTDPGTVAVASGPTAEDIRACAWSTLIGWQHELGDSIDFICDQIARKATLTHSSTDRETPL